MAEELEKYVVSEIKNAEKQLAEAKRLIDRLRAAGEDVSKLLTEYNLAKQKLERYKRAFGVR